MNKYFKWKVLLILAVTAAALWKVYPPETWKHFPATDQISLGLDLQGGMHLTLRVDLEAVPEKMRDDAADRALEVIRNRIDQFGVREPSIAKQGRDQIVIQLPGITDHARAKDIIGKTAVLEFRLVAHDPEMTKKAEETGEAPEGYEWLTLKDSQRSEKLLVEKKPAFTGEHLINAGVEFNQSSFGQPVVNIEFDDVGAKLFSDVTAQAAADFRRDGIPRRLAIALDGELRTAPQMKEAIYGGRAVIEGTFTYEEASDTALVLRAGSLPAPVRIEEERTVGPTLGKDSIRQSIMAIAAGAAFVFFFMGGYYLFSGWVANAALALNVVLMMGALAMFGASLTLPGIAGILLTMGMAVDANVLIFERIREEVKLGKAVRSAISSGYAHASTAIWDSNLTTLFSAIIMFYFGSGPIRGFAVTLTIGLITSMFTALFVTRVIFDFLTREGRTVSLKMLSLFGETKFDFIQFRRIAYAISLGIIVIGLVLTARRGANNFGIDFTGGGIQQIRFNGEQLPMSEIRAALDGAGIGEAQIQEFGKNDREHASEVIIKTSVDDVDRVKAALVSALGEGAFEVLRVETVGPAVGEQLREKAVWSIGWSLFAILVYVSIRFKPIYAIAAIVALLHDVLVTIVVFSVTGREFSLSIVAVLLTIVGYSVNDTIVIFDRIRENVKLMRRTSYIDIVNLAVNQTLSRSAITSFTVFLVVLALYFFGGQVINDFAFALIVGLIAGSYSTIFVASPMVVDWMGRKAHRTK